MPLNPKGKTDKGAQDLRGSLKIPSDLKREIKLAAAHHDLPEYKLIREMWHFWKAKQGNDWSPVKVKSEFGSVTPEEVELIRAVLDFSRNPVDDPGGLSECALKSFIKRYRAKGS